MDEIFLRRTQAQMIQELANHKNFRGHVKRAVRKDSGEQGLHLVLYSTKLAALQHAGDDDLSYLSTAMEEVHKAPYGFHAHYLDSWLFTLPSILDHRPYYVRIWPEINYVEGFDQPGMTFIRLRLFGLPNDPWEE